MYCCSTVYRQRVICSVLGRRHRQLNRLMRWPPVPATTGNSPSCCSTANRMTSQCSGTVSVGPPCRYLPPRAQRSPTDVVFNQGARLPIDGTVWVHGRYQRNNASGYHRSPGTGKQGLGTEQHGVAIIHQSALHNQRRWPFGIALGTPASAVTRHHAWPGIAQAQGLTWRNRSKPDGHWLEQFMTSSGS